MLGEPLISEVSDEMSKTVAAISTPMSLGGLAVIRMSGEKALSIADGVFVSAGNIKPSEMAGYTCRYGKVVRDGRTLDDVILTVYKAPHSYTGEDTVEISCHGGVYLAKEVLRLLIENGAEPAPAGEFTKRAFLSGKLDLSSAEGILEIISAGGERELASARLMREGALYKKVSSVRDKLTRVLGNLAAWSDYPDEDLPEANVENLGSDLLTVENELCDLLKSYDAGKILRGGIDTAIVGSPNVGKSTLMNRLLGYERSITTSIAGTTRDVIEESARVGNLTLKLCDTAGIRDTSDPVECKGVSLAREKLENAELVLIILDGSRKLTSDDCKLLEMAEKKPHIVLINKSDLPKMIDLEYNSDENILFVSAKDGSGLEKLPETVEKLFSLGGYSDGAQMFINERQRQLVGAAKDYIKATRLDYEGGITPDAVTVYIDEALNSLLELTGERATEAVVNDLFSRFCVGK